MGKNSGVCLRFDIDTFSTRHAYIADVGFGEYSYLPHVLRIANSYGVKLQFCACGQGLKEYPVQHRFIKNAGHPIDSHLYTHRVALTDDITRVTEEVILTEQEFSKQEIAWSGIGATGMYKDGIEEQKEVQGLLTQRGYQWCSTKYNTELGLKELQPYWLNQFLLEIPCAGFSDRHYFYDKSATLNGYIKHVKGLLDEAKEKDLVYCVVLHAGVLSGFDPEYRFVTEIVGYAIEREMPLVTMDQICQWKSACQELDTEGKSPTLFEYLQAEEEWSKVAAPYMQPEKVLDYIGGWRNFPNSRRYGVTINRFGLRGEDCLRIKPNGLKRILCAGDSCVFGGAPDDVPWPAQLQIMLDEKKPLNYQVLNAGVSGHSSRHLAARLPSLLKKLEPDVVLISILANDLWGTDPGIGADLNEFVPEGFIKNIQKAVEICREYGATPVICTQPGIVPRSGEMTAFMIQVSHQATFLGEKKQPDKMRNLYDRYNDALRSLALSFGIRCIDIAAYFDEIHDDRRGQLFADTCHMFKEGYTEVAKFISEKLLSMV